MENYKYIIYILACIGMVLASIFYKELQLFSFYITYTSGVLVGFVLWYKKSYSDTTTELELKEENKKLRFMVENGLGYKDLENDCL